MKFIPICLNILCEWKGSTLDFTEDYDFICPHCYHTTIPIHTLVILEEDSVSRPPTEKVKNRKSSLE